MWRRFVRASPEQRFLTIWNAVLGTIGLAAIAALLVAAVVAVAKPAAQKKGARNAPLRVLNAPEVAARIDDPVYWAEMKLKAASLREELYQRNIADFGGSSPMMRWCLRFLQHHMRHQGGPKAGKFVPPAPAHHALLATYERLLGDPRRPDLSERYPRIAGMMGRDFGKTTYGTTALSLYGITEKGKINVGIICSSKDEAKDRIQNIILELETNERLKTEYGEALRPARDAKNQTVGYTDYQIKLAGFIDPLTGARQQITIKAYEFGKGRIRGRNVGGARFDLIILDDPEVDDLAYSEILREKYWRWFKRAVLRSVSQGGLIAWLGTPIGESSLLMRARSAKTDTNPEGMGWQGPLQPIADVAIKPDGSVVEIARLLNEEPDRARPVVIELLRKPEGVRFLPHWCKRHDEQDINAMLGEMTPEDAAQEMFLLPASLASNPWDVQWFRRSVYDSRDISCHGAGVFEWKGIRLSRPIIRIDSAGSTESSADFTAIGVFALLPDRSRALCIDFVHGRLTVPEQLDKLGELQRIYNASAIYHQKSHFETSAAQFNAVDRSRLWLPMTPVVMNTSAGAKDRLIRETCTPVMNGAVLFCLDGSRGPQERFVEEAKVFPGGKDDALDMLGNAIKDLFDPERTPGTGSTGGSSSPIDELDERESVKAVAGW